MPGRRFGADTAAEPPPRPADPALRKANLRRIFPLFRSYRAQLAVVCTLIVFSAALGVIPSFLLRGVLDTAIPRNDVRLLTALVAGMILISVGTKPYRPADVPFNGTSVLANFSSLYQDKLLSLQQVYAAAPAKGIKTEAEDRMVVSDQNPHGARFLQHSRGGEES